MLRRIAELYLIEAEICGKPSGERRSVRHARAPPLNALGAPLLRIFERTSPHQHLPAGVTDTSARPPP